MLLLLLCFLLLLLLSEIRNTGLELPPNRPRLLSAETVEIFSKDFTEDEIRAETENTFQYNRIGTMNSFLFMAFRVYFDVGYTGRQFRSTSISSQICKINHHRPSTSCRVM